MYIIFCSTATAVKDSIDLKCNCIDINLGVLSKRLLTQSVRLRLFKLQDWLRDVIFDAVGRKVYTCR